MKINSRALLGCILSSGFVLSACSHQHAKSVAPPVVVDQLPAPPVVKKPPVLKAPKVVKLIPAPAPYRDVVVAPVQLQPAPKPTVTPAPLPVATILPPALVVPKIKAKGAYRGAVPVDSTLRQQYQQ